jgi:hypothetical protein
MASYTAINKAVAGLVLEAKKQVIADFAAFLGEKIDFDEDMTGYFEEFTKTLQVEKPPKAGKGKGGKKAAGSSDEGVPKKKRAPSAYNIYIKNKMAEIKEKKPELKGKDLMKAAIEAWNADKATAAAASAASEEEESPSKVAESSDDE